MEVWKWFEVLENSLKRFVHDCALDYDLTIEKERGYKEAFVKLIKELSVKGRVVILIDESFFLPRF